MGKRKARVRLDLSALISRKPTAGPLVTPAEAVAIAISMLPPKSMGQLCSPESPAVRHVLLAIKLAGWEHTPS